MNTILPTKKRTFYLKSGSNTGLLLENQIARLIFSLVSIFIFVFGLFAQTTTFNYTGTIVNYTVPVGINSITIQAKGAQGGGIKGGLGASMTGTFVVTPGQILKVLVGGQGVAVSSVSGGGGGSFVTDALNNPLIVAGGGGGTGNCGNLSGLPGVISTSGTNPNPAQPQNGGGGINGGGGGGAVQGSGAGGGGLLGNGGRGLSGSYCGVGGAGGNGTNGADGTCGGGLISNGGQSFINGGAGGNGGSGTTIAAGGFGGGGAAVQWNCGGGGGGGYSGGGGGAYDNTQHRPGGGGGSYNVGTSQSNLGGVNTGNGVVTITANFIPGAAINLDGNDDYLRTTNPFYQYSNEITVEAWINTTQSVWMGQSTPNVDNWSNGNVWLWHIKAPGQGMDWLVNDNGTIRSISLNTLASGWHHIATVANKCGMFIYVDGVLTVSNSSGITTGILNVANSVIDIGKDPRFSNVIPSGTDRYTAFSADEVRIWNRSLSNQEINAHKNCELVAGQMTGLQEYYQFNQGVDAGDNTTITTITDVSGNNRNASINNLARTGTNSNFIAPGGVLTGSSCTTFTETALVASSNSPVNVGSNLNLTATGSPYTLWSWSGPNGFTSNLQNPNIPSITSAGAGTYTVLGTNIGNCKTISSSTSVVINSAATGLNFDGVNDYVTAPSVAAMNFGTSTDFTYEAWIKLDGNQPNYAGIVVKGGSSGYFTQLVIVGNKIAAEINSALGFVGVAQGLQGTTLLNDGQWHHVAMVVSRFNNNAKLLVDGNVEANVTNTAISADVSAASIPLLIGNDRTFVAKLKGTLDEIRIWNRAVCQSEIQNNKNCLLNPNGQTGLITLYRFDQGFVNASNTGLTVATDASGNGNNGTLTNFALSGATSNWSAGTLSGTCATFTAVASVISGNNNLCLGSTSILTANLPDGKWTSSNPAIATINATTGLVTSIAAGTSTISYSNPCGAVSTTIVTVNLTPAPIITSPINGFSTCNSSVNFNGTATPNSSISWYINGNIAGTTIAGSDGLFSFIGSVAGSYTVKSTVNGCTTSDASAAVSISFNNIPVFNSIPSNMTVATINGQCNTAVTYTVGINGFSGATTTYSFSGATTASGNGTGSGNAFNYGTTTVTITATNICGSTTTSFTVTVTAVDTDGDGIPDGCDADADNDGIPNVLECNKSNFFWSNPPSVSGTNATGTINGIGYTYTSSSNITTTGNLYGHHNFPTVYNVPNANPTIQNINVTNNTISFGSPMTNPVLVFASIGQAGLSVPIEFGAPIEVVWSKDVAINSSTKITGTEGYAIVRMMGTFSSISFNYLVAENYCNFAFGADFQSCGDTDGDGSPDYLDTDSDGDGCPDAIEGSMSFSMSQLNNGRLNGSVNAQGIPLLAGSGQNVGTSQNYIINCFCQPGLDETNPIAIAKNITLSLDASGSATINANQVNNGSTDNCGISSMVLSKTSFNCNNLGDNTVTLTVTDAQGNLSSVNAIITVIDNQIPLITAPANISVIATSAQGAVVNYVAPVGTDNCSATTEMTAGYTSGSVFPIGVTTVTYTATDASGNTASASFTVTVSGLAPVVVVPANITVNVDENTCGAAVSFAATDNTGIPASTITYTENGMPVVSGATFSTGLHTITATATNAVGSSSASFTITVIDNQMPVISAPTNISVIATSAQGAVVNYVAPVGTDNCGVNTVMTAGLPSGSTFPIGTTTVTYTVTDASGNTASASFTVTVSGLAPVIVAPENILQNNDAGQCGAAVSFAATETTAIPASTIVYTENGQIIESGHFFSVGTHTITATATNAVGSSTADFTITVIDAEAPKALTQNLTVTLNASGQASISAAQINAASTDNCGIASIAISKENFDCSNLGANTVTLTVTDVHGNIATATATVTVIDTESPLFNVAIPADVTVECNAVPAAAVLTATDNCSAVVTMTEVRTDGSSVNDYTLTRTWTATDASGNSTVRKQVITVRDTQAPSLTVPANISVFTDNNVCGAAVSFAATATDNCSPASISYSHNPGTVFPVGITTVTVTATDPSGNATVLSFTVSVTDKQAPLAIAKNITVGLSAVGGTVSITAADINNGSSDACGIASMTVMPSSFSCANVGANTVTLTVTDVNGNVSTTTAIVTVVDDKGPVPTAVLPVISGQCSVKLELVTKLHQDGDGCNSNDRERYHRNTKGKGHDKDRDGRDDHDGDDEDDDEHENNGAIQIVAPTAFDNCSGLIKGTTTDPLVYNNQGTYIIHWKFVDARGNVTIQEQTVIVKDTQAPRPKYASLPTITGQCSVSIVNTNNSNDDGDHEGRRGDDHDGDDDHDHYDEHQRGALWAKDNCSGWVRGTTTDPLTYSVQGTYIIHWTFNDGHGNISTQNQTVIVKDITKPKIKAPNDKTVTCGSNTAPAVMGMATATDNCSVPVISYTDVNSGNQIVRTWKATDAAGNISTDVQTIKLTTAFSGMVVSVPTSNVYTGGEVKNLYLGYGAQSTALTVSGLPSSGAPYTYSWTGVASNRLSATNTAAPVFSPIAGGVYTFTVTMTNKNGCSNKASISICVTDIRVPGSNGALVYVCHKGSGKTGGTKTLQVPVAQVASHIQAGSCGGKNDRLGSCDQNPCNSGNDRSEVDPKQLEEPIEVKPDVKTAAAPVVEELKVVVMPNPTTTYFTIRLESKDKAPVNLRVMDGSGRVIDAKQKMEPNSSFQMGHGYSSGTYYAEFIQGNKRKVIQLIKGRG